MTFFLQKEVSRSKKTPERYFIYERYRPEGASIDEVRKIGEVYTKEFAESFQKFIDNFASISMRQVAGTRQQQPAAISQLEPTGEHTPLLGDSKLVKCGFKKLPKAEIAVERPKVSHSDRIGEPEIKE